MGLLFSNFKVFAILDFIKTFCSPYSLSLLKMALRVHVTVVRSCPVLCSKGNYHKVWCGILRSVPETPFWINHFLDNDILQTTYCMTGFTIPFGLCYENCKTNIWFQLCWHALLMTSQCASFYFISLSFSYSLRFNFKYKLFVQLTLQVGIWIF